LARILGARRETVDGFRRMVGHIIDSGMIYKAKKALMPARKYLP